MLHVTMDNSSAEKIKYKSKSHRQNMPFRLVHFSGRLNLFTFVAKVIPQRTLALITCFPNLGIGATYTEVKVACMTLARKYYPDKHNPEDTNMLY